MTDLTMDAHNSAFQNFNRNSTVTVHLVEGRNIIRMVWNHQIHSEDVAAAFRTITYYLDKVPQPVHIIVDIQQNPKFPIQTTIAETLAGPFRHPKMGQWLVLGTSRMAKLIAAVLIQVANRDNIVWFEEEAALWAYAAKLGY